MYVSYETTTLVIPPGEAQGYWICDNCGHIIYKFGEHSPNSNIPTYYIESRSVHLLKELEDEVEKVRKWMRGKDAPPEIMKAFERTRRRRCVWTFG